MVMANKALVLLAQSLCFMTAHAFNKDTESCRPPKDAYQGRKSNNWVSCGATGFSDSVIAFTCPGNRGQVRYRFTDNHIALVSGAGAIEGQFTIHGVCLDGDKQVAHVDIYSPATGEPEIYGGMNRECDITKKAGRHVQFFSYTLTKPEMDKCAQNPLIPE